MGLIEDYERNDNGRVLKIARQRVEGYVAAIKSSLVEIEAVKSKYADAGAEVDEIMAELRVLIKDIE